MRASVLFAAALALLVASASSGGATFPGRNGLVVSTVTVSYGEADVVGVSGGLVQAALPRGTPVAGPVVPSPDGSLVAYTAEPLGAERGCYVARAGGGDARRLGDTFQQVAPSWSPNGSRIAFTERTGSESQPSGSFIAVGNADGTNVHRIAEGDQPVWSPDGKWLAFFDGSGDVSVVAPDGTGLDVLEQMSPPYSQTWYASWSPDSRLLAFAEDSRIVVRSVEDSERRVIAEGYYPAGLAWSPDGEQISFAGSLPGTAERSVFDFPAGGGTPEKVVDSSALFGVPWFTSWSPDGSRLLISGFNDVAVWDGSALHFVARGPEYPGLFVGAAGWAPAGNVVYAQSLEENEVAVRSGSSPWQALTKTPDSEADPAWSADGRRIAFVRGSPNAKTGGIFVMKVDGTGERQITTDRGDRGPSWSPGGAKLAFLRGRDIDVVPSTGGAVRTLVRSKLGFFQVEWSPDGRRIAYATHAYRAYVRDLRTSKTKRLTPRRFRDFAAIFDYGVNWSPTGRRIAIARTECVDGDCHQAFQTVAVLDSRTGRVIRNPGVDCPTSYTPEGYLACNGAAVQPVRR